MPTKVRFIRRRGIFADTLWISGCNSYICESAFVENWNRAVLPMRIGLKFFVAAAVALLAAGCGGSNKGGDSEEDYDGWVLVQWNGDTALAGMVYLQLGGDGTFVLYQSINTFGYTRHTGTYSIGGESGAEQVISGTYASGTPWDSCYVIEKYTKKELRIRARKDGIVSVYSGVVVPAYVKDGVTGGEVRSAVWGKPFL